MYIVVQVACISCDGASQNRKFFKLHANMKHTKHGVTYRSEDILRGDGSHVYFVSDVSHLIKTVTNNWYGSRLQGPRLMQVYII